MGFWGKMCYTFFAKLMKKILMNWIFKNKKTPSEKLAFLRFFENKKASQGKRTKGILLAFFLVSGFLFFQTKNVKAADSNCLCFTGTVGNSGGASSFKKSGDPFNVSAVSICQAQCASNGANAYCFDANSLTFATGCVLGNNVLTTSASSGATLKTTVTNSDPTANLSTTGKINNTETAQAVCSVGASTVKLDLVEAFKCILYSVLQGLGWIFGIVASLFQWVVDPVNISGGAGMLNKPEVKNVWIMVRDTLNMTFIMVLLFAAFCTVFQVDKWNLKKVWLNILINALLVNFSFPIARIFIDISNVAMYYFLNHLFTGTGGGSGSAIMASFGDQAKLGVLLKADDYAKADMTYLLAAIIFTFILGLTLLVLAVMFVIRLVALTILLMFSPIGFVGFIFPGTSKFASDWWDNLFKNAFFGPIMVFMMMVALTIMKAAPIETFNAAASGNVAASQVNWIAKAAYYSIPIIVLWTAMGISQSMGIAGASAVVGKAQGFAGKVGSWFTTKPIGLIGKGAKMGAVSSAKWAERNILGEKLSPRAWMAAWKERGDEAEKRFLGKATGGARDRLNMIMEGAKTDYRQLAIDKGVMERRKEMADSTEHTSYWMNNLVGMVGEDSDRARKDIKSFMGIAFKNRDQDEIMKFVRDNYTKKFLAGGKSFSEIGIKEDELGVSSWNVDQVVARMLEASKESKKQVDKTLLDLGEIAAGNGSVGYGGADYDADGKLVVAEDKAQQAATVVGKLATTGDAQELARKIHRNNITAEIQEDEIIDGKKTGKKRDVMVINPEFDEMVRQGVLTTVKDHVNRHNGSFLDQVGRDDRALKGMRERLNKLKDIGGDVWDADDRKVLKNQKITEEEYRNGMAWVDSIETFAKTGAKGGPLKPKTEEQEKPKAILVDAKGRPMSS
jgi:hypothetical protein